MPPERKSQPRTPELAAYARAIQGRMDELGLHQKALADASKIDIRRVGDYVRGQHGPSMANTRKLCAALGLSVDEFFTRVSEQEEALKREAAAAGATAGASQRR